ncbi:MAG: calcium-binding protein [Gemmobacter sp.]|uniref:calcium-binding protein n=1 Tax=Gemmobacter sp. TaxID=1898957 RepID=UPI001A4433C3|nr:calcium-binding protein [Gemmobacter sp.]MBL8561398.1 calcium-binding protein [Gemmobacter sp.]
MTLIIATNVNNEGDGYLLFGNDSIRVDAGVAVISTGASAIASWEGAHSYQIYGTLHGEDDGLKMLGTAETCHVYIAASALITSGGLGLYTHSNGVVLDGLNTTMYNAGHIDAANAAIWALIRDGGTTVITNTGVMEGVHYGIYAPFGFGTMKFTNRGTLSGEIGILGAPGIDLINNEGLITGSINLREGDDVVVTRGRLDGTVALGAGHDSYTDRGLAGLNDDQVSGDAGNDSLNGGTGNDTLLGGDDADSVNGGLGNDSLEGNDGDDLLLSGGGDDTLVGGAGNDRLDDALTGSRAGTLLAHGGEGADTLGGGRGADTLHGDAGDDLVTGDAGADWLDGGAGNDTVLAGEGNDTVAASGGGDDSIQGGGGADQLIAGAGADTVLGDGGNDVINGGEGADRLSGGLGYDTLTGGAGADTFVFDSLRERGDTITDFTATEDRIILSATAFGYDCALSGQQVSAEDCVTGAAQDASDHFIYNSATHTLYFDADGNGSARAVALVTFETDMAGWSLWFA